MQLAIAVIGSGLLSTIISWIFKRLDAKKDKQDQILAEIASLQNELAAHASENDRHFAIECRVRILRFNDEILHDVKHTQQHFEQILQDITSYDRYSETHPEFPNNVTVSSAANIQRVYDDCLTNHNFL